MARDSLHRERALVKGGREDRGSRCPLAAQTLWHHDPLRETERDLGYQCQRRRRHRALHNQPDIVQSNSAFVINVKLRPAS